MQHHEFQPSVFHSTMGSHPPILEVEPGDRITTTTLDAWGTDAHGRTRLENAENPQTGPFFVRGAMPGDTLMVGLERLRPNRETGVSLAAIVPNALDFDDRPTFEDDVDRAEWRLDNAEGTVSLVYPANRIANRAVRQRPMLGCFGVAPARGQAIACSTSGPYGGNMDYNGFGEGVTVCFPVFSEGALFHLGDGHVLQSDGEIYGSGIEVSMEVTFTLDLSKHTAPEWPRAENDSHLMTIGSARPLDQALQHATSEMVRWLMMDFGLSVREAHLLLGHTGEYDLGNICDPAYTMVCKMSKSILRNIGLEV